MLHLLSLPRVNFGTRAFSQSARSPGRKMATVKAAYGLRPAELEGLKKNWAKLDADGSGKANAIEVAEFFKSNPEHKDKFMVKYDVDGDGKVSWDEFVKTIAISKHGLASIAKAVYGLPDEVATNIEATFKKMDKDNSGRISLEEAKAFFASPLYTNKFEAKYDANKDNTVTWSEYLKGFVTARYGLPANAVEQIKKNFDAYDKDGSGKVTEEELKEFLKARGDRVEEIKAKYDIDGDGLITWEEFIKVVSKKK